MYVLKCKKDGYMSGCEGNPEYLFCQSGLSYQVIKYNSRYFTIIDERTNPHELGVDFLKQYFDVIEIKV